jgi:hypothetical protein
MSFGDNFNHFYGKNSCVETFLSQWRAENTAIADIYW